MESADENSLVERVFLRIGSAETDEQLETSLARFLPAVLLKLDSKEEGVRKKVMELLVHINKRLKSRTKVQLPVDDLIQTFTSQNATSILMNFAVIYIKMGFPRLDPQEQAARVPALMACLEGRSQSQQDSFLQLLIPAFAQLKFPVNMEERRQKFQCLSNPSVARLLLDYILDLLIVPYGSHVKVQELQQAQTSRRPTSATPGADSTPPPAAPPGLSQAAFKRVMGDAQYPPEQLEKVKMSIIHFLGAELFPVRDVFCHLVIGAADTRHSVATAADMELKKQIGSMDLNDTPVLNKLYSLVLGTLEMKGQVGVKPELKCMPACTRIRMKILPHLLKARQSANIFPSNIQLIFDLLYGINTNTKLKAYGIQMIHHMCLNCTDQKFATFSPVLQTKLINLVRESEEDPKVIRLAYVALGKLVHKFPQLVSTNIALVQVFFSVISQVDSETRLAVQEALALMADAFRDLSDLNRAMMEALLTEAIDKDDPQSRMMAVQYCEKIFPRDHVPASYILLLAAGDQKEDIRIEARKALNITGGMDKLTSNKSPVALDTIILPAFPRMVLYIKEKADLRVTSQKRYEGSGHTLPFNPATFSEILVFLRACLARSAGLPPDVDGVADMKEQAPVISKYVSALLKEDSSERSPVQTYVTLAVMLVKAAVGELPMYCLLEMVAMAAELLVPQFIKHLDWLKTLVFSKNDGIRDHAANLYAIVVCSRGDEGCTLDALETMQKSLSNKVLETQHGAMLTLGYMVGQLLRRTRQGDGSRAVSPKILTIMEKAVRDIACMIKGADESSPLLVSGACQSLGEIGRNAPLTLPLGGGDASTEEITKLSVINNLLAIVKSGKENVKSKERAALCLGQLCVGDPGLPYRRMVIEGLMKSVTTRQVDLQIGLGEALVFAAQGPSAPIGRDMWTQTEAEWKERADSDSDEVEWYVTELLAKYVVSTNPHVRQASSVWLLALVKGCSAHPALQGRLLVLQSAFMQLLSENDELTQDISSKGLGLVYDVCSKEQKEALVGELVDTLTTGKRKVQKVSADTQVFEEDSIGKTPDGGNLSTYKELCSIANDLNQPDLIYKFMHLANHHALWNSKKGAAFGFSTIAAQAGEQLAPYLPQIVPRLYRYQFDPNIKIQRAMTSIWNSLVKDNKSTVDTYLKEILEDLLCNLTNAQWRIRESSCLAVHDLLRGRALDDVVEALPQLWESCLRVLDDIKESVRKAAEMACTTLSKASIKICDVTYGKVGERATSLVLPCLLKTALPSPVTEVRALGLSTLLKISKTAGVMLKPHIAVLVTALLEAVSGLEPQVMNYLSVRVSQETQNRLDNARIVASKMSPMMETVNLCVQYVDDSVLPELVPRLTELIRSGIGLGTKAACSHFVISLVHQCPQDLAAYTGKLMSAFLHGVADRNMAIRKAYAQAMGNLVKIAKDTSVEKLISRMRSWYLEKEEESAREACSLTLHAISQYSPDVLRRHAAITMPLTFLAMHEKVAQGVDRKTDEGESLWEELWMEVTPGMEGGIKLYQTEIVTLLCETLQSQSWTMKAQASRALSTVAEKLGPGLGALHLQTVIQALLAALQGRTWAGKEEILHALKNMCKHCSANILENKEGLVEQVLESVFRESRKEAVGYKLEAVSCLAQILEDLQTDRLQDLYAVLAPVLEMSSLPGENREEELSSDVKQQQYVVYYTALGQAWPAGATATHESYLEKITCLMCDRLHGNSWKIQEAILKSLNKIISRTACLSDSQSVHNTATIVQIFEKIVVAVLPCFGNLKYTVIRTESLQLVQKILTKLADLQLVTSLSEETRNKLRTDLVTMTTDSSVELQNLSQELSAILDKSVQQS